MSVWNEMCKDFWQWWKNELVLDRVEAMKEENKGIVYQYFDVSPVTGEEIPKTLYMKINDSEWVNAKRIYCVLKALLK